MRKCIKEFHSRIPKTVHQNPCENVGLNHEHMSDDRKGTVSTERKISQEEKLKIIQEVIFKANSKNKT